MPKFFRLTLRYSRNAILLIVAFIATYLLSSFCLSGITVNNHPPVNTDVTIFIKTNGIHTDLVVPVKNRLFDWSRTILFSNTHVQDTGAINWLALGWGDKGFYLATPTWADLTFSTAFKAAFALSSTAIHATYYSNMNENALLQKNYAEQCTVHKPC